MPPPEDTDPPHSVLVRPHSSAPQQQQEQQHRLLGQFFGQPSNLRRFPDVTLLASKAATPTDDDLIKPEVAGAWPDLLRFRLNRCVLSAMSTLPRLLEERFGDTSQELVLSTEVCPAHLRLVRDFLLEGVLPREALDRRDVEASFRSLGIDIVGLAWSDSVRAVLPDEEEELAEEEEAFKFEPSLDAMASAVDDLAVWDDVAAADSDLWLPLEVDPDDAPLRTRKRKRFPYPKTEEEPKKPGRPRKAAGPAPNEGGVVKKRGRGRPRKVPQPKSDSEAEQDDAEPKPKIKREVDSDPEFAPPDDDEEEGIKEEEDEDDEGVDERAATRRRRRFTNNFVRAAKDLKKEKDPRRRRDRQPVPRVGLMVDQSDETELVSKTTTYNGKVYEYKYPKDNSAGVTPVFGKPRTRRGPQKLRIVPESARDLSYKYQCRFCAYGSNWYKSMFQHEMRHQRTDERHSVFCELCKMGFEHMDDKNRHYREEHRGKRLECPYCPKVYMAKFERAYKAHVDAHKDSGNFQCVACGFKSDGPWKQKDHKRIRGEYHDDQCVQCDARFTSWSEHQEHVRREHEDRWKYRCGFCPLVFSSQAETRGHRQKAHDDQYDNKVFCELCGKSVKGLKSHMDDMHGTHHLPCSECDLIFKHPNTLKRHMRGCHSQIPCEHCGKILRSTSKHKQHVLAMHTPDDQKPYQCQVCTKGFPSAAAFKEHMNIHTNAKPHLCRYCGVGFNNMSNKYHHEKSTHLGMKRDYSSRNRAAAKGEAAKVLPVVAAAPGSAEMAAATATVTAIDAMEIAAMRAAAAAAAADGFAAE